MAEGGAASTSKVSSTKKRIETDADVLFFLLPPLRRFSPRARDRDSRRLLAR